ncbi:MAG: response regulator transcription factor [Actinobacteria bacterium]|nr:response regulator transcription factor [Actinomycetota bacterium]
MPGLIYIVDDNESILEILEYNLSNNGYRTRVFKNGKSFLGSFNEKKPDLVILDLMLPDMDGYDICKEIREKTSVPVLILSARGEEFDKVLGLELGADDYMVKPFGIRELLARVKNILKRIGAGPGEPGAKPLQKEYDFGGIRLCVDEEKHEIILGGRPVGLNPKEFMVVVLLLKNMDSLVPRMELIKSVWGADYYGDTRTLDVHIRRIREKMSYGDFGRDFIKTVHGLGYKVTSRI